MRIWVNGFGLGASAARLPAAGVLEVPAQTSVQEVLERLALPVDVQSALILFRNGRPVRRQDPLQAGDRLTLLPSLEGG